eukprot:scaffold156774_cov35-Tisochrysis_lutea.AAC.1
MPFAPTPRPIPDAQPLRLSPQRCACAGEEGGGDFRAHSCRVTSHETSFRAWKWAGALIEQQRVGVAACLLGSQSAEAVVHPTS